MVAPAIVAFGCGPRETPSVAPPAPPKPGFREAATESGIDFRMRFLEGEQGANFKVNLYDHGCGLAVADYNGDGHEDVYFVNQLGPNALYRNRGDGTFENTTEEAGVGVGDRICVCASWADYDNDGDPDLFVTSTRGGNLLFRNDKGKFKDVTKQAGVAFVGHSQTGSFFDYDNDGFLDLIVVNTAEWTASKLAPSGDYYPGKGDAALGDMAGSRVERNLLYHNEGNGTFKEVAEKAGLSGSGWCADVVVTDYDQDGYQDVLISRMFGAAELYRNRRNGTFEEVAFKVLGKTPWGGMGARVFDYDGDGLLDIAIVDMHSDMWMGVDRDQLYLDAMRAAEKKRFDTFTGPILKEQPVYATELEKLIDKGFGLSYEHIVFGNALYRNLGGGKYEDVCLASGFETMWPWGMATGDFDSDGDEDVFMPAGMGYPFVYWPNYLLMNNGKGLFEQKASAFGIEPPPGGTTLAPIAGAEASKSSRCAVSADFDRDGRLDLMVNNFNDRPYYYRNQFSKGDYLSLKLIGTKCNRDAIGAVVQVKCGERTLVKQVEGVGGYLSQSSSVLLFSLPEGTTAESIEIIWPGGTREIVRSPAVNTRIEISQEK